MIGGGITYMLQCGCKIYAIVKGLKKCSMVLV